MKKEIRSTTIIGVRHKRKVAMAGDGQVTFGEMMFKQKAVKVREFKTAKNNVLGGFAGADATNVEIDRTRSNVYQDLTEGVKN